MCKSSAEGGQRCQGHLSASTTAAMTTYVVHTTGLDRPTVDATMADLRAEFADAPAPDRAEVDQFLEQQAFRVRHEPDLTEKRRDSIMSRLRAGIGRLLPDGPTYAAWKNVLASAAHRAWKRARKPVIAVGVGAAAVGFVAGATTFMGGMGEYYDAYHTAEDSNVAMAVHDKYGDTITGEADPYGRYLEQYTVNGKTELCNTDYESNDDLTVNDVTIECENADGDFVPLPASGKVDPSAQTPFVNQGADYFW